MTTATAAAIAPGPQHLRALERANLVRLARAESKRRVGAGELAVADVILSCPWETETMTVFDLLMAQRRWGATRARKFLGSIPLSESKTIGTLTERQRLALATRLSAGARAEAAEVRLGLVGNARFAY